MARIIDKIRARRKKRKEDEQKCLARGEEPSEKTPSASYYSFEFFPPKTEAGVDNLQVRIERMVHRLSPLFIDVTWGACGSTSERTLTISSYAQRYCGVDVLLHLTCTGMSRGDLKHALDRARSCGIQNILALRGDAASGMSAETGAFERSIDLVRLIREEYGDYFGIGVAGHPEGHPSSKSVEFEMMHLKEKIDCGADFILTQFFYDTEVFVDYVKTCRSFGITCPIIPGIMPIPNYSSFVRMTKFCGTKVPPEIMERLDPVKNDDEAVKDIGCDIAADMCRRIFSCPDIDVDGVHFYTLNLERSVTRIISSLATDLSRDSGERQFPWRTSAIQKRNDTEQVRPINWANRPKSYVMRTDDWDEFPNGRWSDPSSPAFGELSDFGHFYYNAKLADEDDLRAILGDHPISVKDINKVFTDYVLGKIPHLPWCENSLQPETGTIQTQLSRLNHLGLLTINSQPPANGVSSDHPVYGWGGKGGYVYQKAYLECFISKEHLQILQEIVQNNDNIDLYATDYNKTDQIIPPGGGVTALTWGVFPNREIVQPTIFDPDTFFHVWADEAFGLWSTMWMNLYDEGSESYELIQRIRDEFFLVAIIDNDFMGQNQICDQILELFDKRKLTDTE